MAHRALAIFRRRLFAGLTILSLLLCLATVALWVRSYWRSDILFRFSGDAQSAQAFGMASNLGELFLFADPYPAASDLLKQGWNFNTGPSSADETIASFAGNFPPGRSAHFLGFGFGHNPAPNRTDMYVAPHWFVALLFAALPAVRLRSILRTRRQNRRNRAGLCQHCGYDLRATPQGGRCPECGHAAAAAPASQRLTAPRSS